MTHPWRAPAMRGWMLAVVGCLVAAGCLGSGDAPTEPTDTVPPTLSAGNAVFDDGGALPAPGDTLPGSLRNGTTRFHYTGHNGAEPNIGITSTGAVFVTAFEETLRSRDGGRTWDVVQTYSFGQGLSGIGTNDPMMWVDTDTDRVFVNHMISTNCFNMLWSDDEGETWIQRDLACIIPSVDHQKVMTAPPGPGLNPQTALLVTYPNVLYTCYNALLGTQCFASFDGGLTYTQESIANQGACAGVQGHPSAAPDGTIAMAAGWNCGPVVMVSSDSGLTWTVRTGPPGGSAATLDPDITFDDSGGMYLMWRTEDHYMHVARSHDLGASWDAVWNVTVPGLTSTRFNVLAAGDDGRLAMAYLGTSYREPKGEDWNGDGEAWDHSPTEAPPNTPWHLYIVTTDDSTVDDPVWVSHKVTPDDDPVQKGCIWEGGGGGGERLCRNLLDFIDSVVAPDGTYYVVYTEGCTVRENCAGRWQEVDEMDARDREIAVAALDGWKLHA